MLIFTKKTLPYLFLILFIELTCPTSQYVFNSEKTGIMNSKIQLSTLIAKYFADLKTEKTIDDLFFDRLKNFDSKHTK